MGGFCHFSPFKPSEHKSCFIGFLGKGLSWQNQMDVSDHPYRLHLSIGALLVLFYLPVQTVSRNSAGRTFPLQLQLICFHVQMQLCWFRLHCRNTKTDHRCDGRPERNQTRAEDEHARTVVLDLQGEEAGSEQPVRRRSVHTEVDISEIRERFVREVTAAPHAAQHDVLGTFLGMVQFTVPAEDTETPTNLLSLTRRSDILQTEDQTGSRLTRNRNSAASRPASSDFFSTCTPGASCSGTRRGSPGLQYPQHLAVERSASLQTFLILMFSLSERFWTDPCQQASGPLQCSSGS